LTNVIKRATRALFAKAGYSIIRTAALEQERVDRDKAKHEQLIANAAVQIEVRPLRRLADDALLSLPVDGTWVARIVDSQIFDRLSEFFRSYPRYSLMSDRSRAFLYLLVRAMKPEAVAEIGTFFAGTSEVFSRALWENKFGVLHTVDPYGGARCPGIIRQWPKALQDYVRYYDANSMEFFHRRASAETPFDIILIDGNHELEFALFDLQMAARLIRRGGMIVMDNAEQTGPFWAAVRFLAENPDWTECGGAIEGRKTSRPFDSARASIPGTSFLVLQAPRFYIVSAVPRSWAQKRIDSNRVNGFAVEIDRGLHQGRLHFQLILRSFRNYARDIDEYQKIGSVVVECTDSVASCSIEHHFEQALASNVPGDEPGCSCTLEIELAWEAAPGRPDLRITAPPREL
jgi:predicted O-methyltransferase YrrM